MHRWEGVVPWMAGPYRVNALWAASLHGARRFVSFPAITLVAPGTSPDRKRLGCGGRPDLSLLPASLRECKASRLLAFSLAGGDDAAAGQR